MLTTLEFRKNCLSDCYILLFICLIHILLSQILEIELESSVVEKLNVPRMIDKYPFHC